MKVTLGIKASMFYDPSTRLKVLPGQEVELTSAQENSKRVKNAINSGHLRIVTGEAKLKQPNQSNQSEAVDPTESFRKIYDNLIKDDKPTEVITKKLIESFNREQLEAVCLSFNIEPEDEDNKSDLVSAIIEELTEESNQ